MPLIKINKEFKLIFAFGHDMIPISVIKKCSEINSVMRNETKSEDKKVSQIVQQRRLAQIT